MDIFECDVACVYIWTNSDQLKIAIMNIFGIGSIQDFQLVLRDIQVVYVVLQRDLVILSM